MTTPITTPRSPLTGSSRVELLRRYPIATLTRRWQRQFGIDISKQLGATTEISHWRCLDTGLQFFQPGDAAGSSELYAQLSRFGWYHDQHRWEFSTAMPWLRDTNRILEVGCGDGAFLDQLRDHSRAEAIGIELNPATAAAAQAKGHRIVRHRSDSAQVTALGQFDAVCSFQVLEHVPDPHPFIESLCARLADHGLLILGVPNADSFIRHQRINLLDMPPHHMSRWNSQAMASIARLFALQTLSIEAESLSRPHAVDYIETQVQRIAPLPILPRTLGRLLGPLLARTPQLRTAIQGHSLIGIYRKMPAK
jgi:SAM-dependent methyltransferase